MKQKLKSVSAVAVILILFTVFASICRYHEVTRYDLVSGMSFDLDKDKWTVVCEICTASSNDDFGSKTEYVKGTGFTLEEALNNAALKSTNILYTDSAQLYLVGESAKNNGELYGFLKSRKSNLRAVITVCDKKAGDALYSESDPNTRAKSLSLADKMRSFCDENKLKKPDIINFLKGENEVYLNDDLLPERRGN